MIEDMKSSYSPNDIEDKWYEFWEEKGFFHQEVDKSKKPFSIVMPPPNVTGQLHMGHALDNTMQDIITRYKRMDGYNTLWLPGCDHAGIATQAKVEEDLRVKEGLSRHDIGREEFLKRTFAWKDHYQKRITGQLRKLGSSCDWNRERFTMDEGLSRAVREAFVGLYEKGLIYKGKYIVNWCPKCQTTISDIEVEHNDRMGHLYHVKYPIVGEDGVFMTVATTRPETLLGDTALAVNPNDERYVNFVGKKALVPVVDREIPIIADDYVDMQFGTGVVKITPFHDPNDFEVGQRHKLEQIEVIGLDGKMTDKAGKYLGMDRYECREAIIADLEKEGLFIKKDEHEHAVGECYRCGTVVEPLISPQWFMKMDEMAKRAMAEVDAGNTKFVPARFTKIYMAWMENIRDWCISRQLWWGHRIPVWYCEDCGEMHCSREDLTVCPSCGGKVYQDEDVLDTWFSSALWPFSTMGWPDETADLEHFYPTNVLVTGRDIIFFWVARMIFSGLNMMDKVPFDEVLMHGLVLDSEGRKMSKSLNNGIDPLEVITECGADPLRFMLITGNTPGNDIRFRAEKLEGSRNFANKIWNASKFVLMNLEGYEDGKWSDEELSLHDKWILAKLNNATKVVRDSMDKYELGEAAYAVYDFMWNDFCDWYIELSKTTLYKGESAEKLKTQRVLIYCLRSALELLHPFMPFITEEIWQALPHNGETIMLAEYPKYDENMSYGDAVSEMNLIIDIIRGIRNLRAEMKVPLGEKANIIFLSNEDKDSIIKAGMNYIMQMAKVGEISFVSKGDPVSDKVGSAIIEGVTIYMPLEGLIDMEKEIARLEKELANTTKEIKRLNGKLSNEGFLAKAPANVVEGEKEKLVGYEKQYQAIEEQLKSYR